MATWIIDEDRGKWDVLRNGKAFAYEFDDEGEALDAIRGSGKFSLGDTVWRQEASGWREKVRV